MIQRIRCLFLAVALWAVSGAFAQTDNTTAEDLVRSSGLWEQLGHIGPQVQAGLADAMTRSGRTPSAAETERTSRAIQVAYAPARLRAIAVDAFARHLKAREVVELRAWYGSPVGQRITHLEETASKEAGDPQAFAQQGRVLLEKSSPQRRRLLEDLTTETRAAEVLTNVTIHTATGVQRGLASVLPDMPARSVQELRAELEAQRPNMMKAFASLSLGGYAKVYASLPTEHLEQYLVFVRSPVGRVFHALATEAFNAAVTDAATEFGRRLPGTKDQSNT